MHLFFSFPFWCTYHIGMIYTYSEQLNYQIVTNNDNEALKAIILGNSNKFEFWVKFLNSCWKPRKSLTFVDIASRLVATSIDFIVGNATAEEG